MDKDGINGFYQGKKAVFNRKGPKLNVIAPRATPQCEINKIVPAITAKEKDGVVFSISPEVPHSSASCGNSVEFRKTPPLLLMTDSCKNSVKILTKTLPRGTTATCGNKVKILMTPLLPLMTASCKNSVKNLTTTLPTGTTETCGNKVKILKTPLLTELTARGENNVDISLTPLENENVEKKREKTNENCIFRTILFIALIIGLPVAPSMLFPGRKKIIHFLDVWNHLVFCIRTILFIIECLFNHCFWASLAQRYSIHGSCIAGYIIMLVLRVKRRKVEKVLRELIRLSSDAYPRGIHAFLKCYEFICFLCCVTYFTFGVYFLLFVWWNFTYKKIMTASAVLEDTSLPFAHGLAWVINLAEVLTYHIGSATLFTSTVLCSRAYLVSSEIMKMFGERLGKDSSEQSLGVAVASRSLRSFNRVFSCVRNLDDVFGICTLMIYMDVINNYYVVMSTLLSGQEKYGSVEVLTNMGIVFLGATLKFLYLTLSGDCLSRRHLTLKNDLIEMSDNVLRMSPKLGIYRFSVITANIRTVDVHVTGMGYFKITRLIIPSAISALITYGVTIYQIGAIEDLN